MTIKTVNTDQLITEVIGGVEDVKGSNQLEMDRHFVTEDIDEEPVGVIFVEDGGYKVLLVASEEDERSDTTPTVFSAITDLAPAFCSATRFAR